MSGCMKYADVGIDPSVGMYDLGLGCIVLGSILAQRATEAAVETAKRLEAEEATLSASLTGSKTGFKPVAESAFTLLGQQKANMFPADHASLCKRLTAAEEAMVGARTHVALQDVVLEIERVKSDIERACRRKAGDDARHGNTLGITAFKLRFEGLRQQASGLSGDPGDGPLGPAGAALVRSAMASAGGALQTTNEQLIASRLDEFENAIFEFEDQARACREETERRNALGAQALSEAIALIAGLRTDPVIARWHTVAVDTLESDLSQISTLIARGEFDQAIQTVRDARTTASVIVKEANSAQIKADQRDYIAKSISSTLEDMGFIVGAPVEEHPGHPATASIVHAAKASGKAIAVSIPVEGQVWYNVDGFVKSVDAKVGGGQAAVCDEAEEVIDQMHEALASEFHVQMGELQWDGKDPNRKLRAAKSVPDSGSSSSRNGSDR